ncbi:MAG: hypothetical protein AB2L12_17535 [Smithellaceae bacterium]
MSIPTTSIADDPGKVLAFSEILARMENTSEKIVVPILKKIESNTSMLRKFNSPVSVSQEKSATAVSVKQTSLSREKKSRTEAIKSEKREVLTAEAKRVGPTRNNKGRFVSSQKTHVQDVNDDSGRPQAKRGRLATLAAFGGHMAKGGVGDKKGTMVEAAGRATLGPMYDAVVELKSRYDQFKDTKNSLKDQYAQFKGTDAAPVKKVTEAKNADETDEIIKSLMNSEKGDKERHEELIEVILKGKAAGGGESMGLPSMTKTGPGATAREKLKRARTKPQAPSGVGMSGKTPRVPGGGGGSLLSKLPMATLAGGAGILVAGAAAAYALSQVAQAITTGESDVNNAFKKFTGIDFGKTTQGDIDKENRRTVENTKRVNAERVAQGKKELEYDPVIGMVKPGAVATASESGKGGAGTVSTGKNDAGGPSYGKKQLASAGGDKSQVAQFIKQSSHAEEFKGLTPGTPAFDQKWKEAAAKDKNFGAEQDSYVAKTMSAPVIAKAVKGGFNTDDVGIREALISQSVNHGPGGNKKILAGAQAELVKKYGTVEAAPITDQIDALTASRKQYVDNVAENKTVTAQKLRAKGDEKGALKAEGEAKQLRSMAGAGGRYDKENAITKELSATGGVVSKTAIAQKPKTEPVVEGEMSRDKATAMEAIPSEPVPVAEAKRVDVAKGRQSILDKQRAKLASRGVGSLDATAIADPATTAAAVTKLTSQEPVTSLATSAPTNIKQVERIQPGMDVAQKTAGNTGTSTGKDSAATSIPGMENLIAMMTKFVGQGEQSRQSGDGQQIRTEFDDTMLTLMAYDRV